VQGENQQLNPNLKFTQVLMQTGMLFKFVKEKSKV
jgi:hypothetical protein